MFLSRLRRLKVTFLGLALLAGVQVASAQEGDPPTRVARLAYLNGAVSMRPSGAQDWVYADLNRPLTTGDDLWADNDGRAELEFDGSAARLSRNTQLGILNLNDHVTQLQLSSGSLMVHVRRLGDDENFEIDTPNIAFSVLRPGVYRLTVTEDGGSTSVAVYRGYGEATGAGQAYSVNADELDTFTGTDNLQADSAPLGRERDDFSDWSEQRDRRYDNSAGQYVSSDVVGGADLDDQGTWTPTPEYGTVWFPSDVGPEWAPYHFGHWAYIAPWGYTWVDDRPWGFAPFHYGRWVSWQGRWGWVPAPPRVEGVAYVRPVYAPALVAWVGAGAAVAWFPLGPREVYVPSYPVSRGYVDRVNISNTRVNTTVINNVYNTTIVNNTTVNNVTYVNQRVPGAVMATSAAAFQSAQPVARNRAQLDARSVVNAPVRVAAPTIVPNRQAFLGPKGPGSRPPAAVQARVATARIRPPAAPPPIAAREQAIRSEGGRVPLFKPMPAAEVRTPVRVAPPVKTLVSAPRVNETVSRAAPPPQAPAPARPPVHVNELPPLSRGPSPAEANSALERQHYQEQQQLQARHAAERQQMEAQQQREHQQFEEQQQARQREAQQAAERARAQQQAQQQAEQLAQQREAQQRAAEAQRQERERQIEAQHQQQTQQLAQEHARQLQELQERQQAQQREQHVQAPPVRRPPPPPNQRQ